MEALRRTNCVSRWTSQRVIYQVVIYQRVIYQRLIYQRVIYQVVIYHRVIYQVVIYHRVIYRNSDLPVAWTKTPKWWIGA